jgi:hypothetical protein
MKSMVSNPIIPEATLVKIRQVVFDNKKSKTGPQSIKAWLNEAAEEKLNPQPDEAEPMPAEERIG